MSVDILSNMLSQIKNASMVNKEYVEVMHTKECAAVAKVLKENNYVKEVKVFKESGKPFKKLRIDLSYDNDLPAITDIKRVSTPGRRIYKGADDIGTFLSGYGLYIVSTSRGVMSGVEARKKRLGGEVMCKVH